MSRHTFHQKTCGSIPPTAKWPRTQCLTALFHWSSVALCDPTALFATLAEYFWQDRCGWCRLLVDTIAAALPPPQHVTRTEVVQTKQLVKTKRLDILDKINTDLSVLAVVVISIVNITYTNPQTI